MYDSGKGVPKDYEEVVKWFRRAAEQGHSKAQNNIGVWKIIWKMKIDSFFGFNEEDTSFFLLPLL